MRFPTMKSVRIQIVSSILAGLISMPVHAEVIPGRWEKVSALDLGTPITVELKNGDRVEGNFEGLSASEVDIETHSVRAVIPRAVIQTITASVKDGLTEGAAIGTAIGAGFVGVVAATSGLTRGLDTSAKGALHFALLAVGVGAALGIAADAAMKRGPIMLYEAPGNLRHSKRGDSEWWPPDPPLSETQPANLSQ